MMIATPLRSFDRRVNAAIGHAHPHVDRRRRQKKGGIALQDGPGGVEDIVPLTPIECPLDDAPPKDDAFDRVSSRACQRVR